MRQEVEVIVKLTLDVNANLSKEQIESRVNIKLNRIYNGFHHVAVMGHEILDCKEENELYSEGQ
jgi:hypothetical protein